MKAFIKKISLVCVCIGVIFSFSSCASIGMDANRPKNQYLAIKVEIHGNTALADYPQDFIADAFYFFPFENLKVGDVVAVKAGETTVMGRFGDDSVTEANYFAKIIGVYSKIDSTPIPRSLWTDSEELISGTTRVLVETSGSSMKGLIPEHALVALSIGYPYEELAPKQNVLFWDPAATPERHFTNHQLVYQFADGTWRTQGVNNAGLPTRMQSSTSGGVTYITTWYNRAADPYPLNRSRYVGLTHKIWRDLTIVPSVIALR